MKGCWRSVLLRTHLPPSVSLMVVVAVGGLSVDIMSTSQRPSRGFHRLALFLAAIPLLIGAPLSVWSAVEMAKRGFDHNKKLVCAHQVFQTDRRKMWAPGKGEILP